MIEWLINIALGAALGTLGGLFGIGGGLIAIPALGVLFGLDQQLAQGTALVMVVPNVLLALWRYHQRNRIELRHALPLAACSFCSLGLGRSGRWASTPIPCAWASWAFWWRWRCGMWRGCSYRSPAEHRAALPWPWLGVLGSFAGAMGGLFGVGGAVVATPILTSVFGATQVVAQGLSLALAAPSTLVTLVTYGVHGSVDWHAGIALAIGGLLSISWGVKLAHALPEKYCVRCSVPSGGLCGDAGVRAVVAGLT